MGLTGVRGGVNGVRRALRAVTGSRGEHGGGGGHFTWGSGKQVGGNEKGRVHLGLNIEISLIWGKESMVMSCE